MGDLGFLKKVAVMGETLVSVQQERKRQMANAPHGPSFLAQLYVKQAAARDGTEEARMWEAAAVRAAPTRANKKPPTTEMEQIIADAPKTSAQVVGHHKVPVLPPEPPKAGPSSDLERMRAVFPRTTNCEAGHHHDFFRQQTREAREATAMVDKLSVAQVRGDAKMTAALKALRGRVNERAVHHSVTGVPKGIAMRAQR